MSSGVWADMVTIFSLTNVKVEDNVSVAASTTHSITASEATIVGGTAEVYNGSGSSQNMLVKSTKQVSISGSGNSYFHISLSGNTFAEGDVIQFGALTGSGKIANTSTRPGSDNCTIAAGGYIIPKGSALIGQTEMYFWKPSSGDVKYFTEFTVKRDNRSALTLSFTPDNQIIATDGSLVTSFAILTDISSESAKYTSPSYTSSNDAVATVTPSGVVSAVAAGTVTITAKVTADADATYKSTEASITVYVNEPLALSGTFLTPTETLDLSDADAASTMLNKAWTNDRPFFGNDGANNYLTFTVFSAFSSKANETWVQVPTSGGNTGASTGEAWDANGVFKGSASYSSNKAATAQEERTYTYYSFCVKGISKVQVRVKGSAANAATLAAYEITAGTPAASTLDYVKCTSTSVETLTLNLDDAKEYLITINNALNNSNSRFYEMALFYDDAVQLYETIAAGTGKTYGTYVTINALDLSTVTANISAYTIPGLNAGKTAVEVTEKTQIPAGSPILFKTASAGASVNVPVATSTPAALGTNCLVAGTGAAVAAGTGTITRYVLSNGVFKSIHSTSPTVAKTKAYLEIDSSSSAHELGIDFGDATGIVSVSKAQTMNNAEYFDLQGRRIAQPTKGLYIVNGKKVIVK